MLLGAHFEVLGSLRPDVGARCGVCINSAECHFFTQQAHKCCAPLEMKSFIGGNAPQAGDTSLRIAACSPSCSVREPSALDAEAKRPLSAKVPAAAFLIALHV